MAMNSDKPIIPRAYVTPGLKSGPKKRWWQRLRLPLPSMRFIVALVLFVLVAAALVRTALNAI